MAADLLLFLQGVSSLPPLGAVRPGASGVSGMSGVTGVSDVTLEVFRGEAVALLDPAQGAGSALVRLLAGLQPATGGLVFLEGRDVTDQAPASRGFGVVLHDDPLPAPMRTVDLVGFPLRGRAMSSAERRRTAAEMLEQAGLSGLGQVPVAALSPLRSRQAAIARAVMRALLFTTPLLLLDEPCLGLEPDARTTLLRGLRSLQAQCHLTILAAMRDPLAARAFADRVAVFDGSRIAQVGTPAEVWANPASLACARATGETNLLPGIVASQGLGTAEVRLPDGSVLPARLPAAIGSGLPCLVQVRPEHLMLDADPGLAAVVSEAQDEGGRVTLILQAAETWLIARLPPGRTPPAGTPVSLGWQRGHATAFPAP